MDNNLELFRKCSSNIVVVNYCVPWTSVEERADISESLKSYRRSTKFSVLVVQSPFWPFTDQRTGNCEQQLWVPTKLSSISTLTTCTETMCLTVHCLASLPNRVIVESRSKCSETDYTIQRTINKTLQTLINSLF